MTNTWGLIFTKVNIEEDKFDTLLSLNTGSEEETRNLFERIKREFKSNTGEPQALIDLVDENDDIIDDYPVTYGQVQTIAALMGHKISA